MLRNLKNNRGAWLALGLILGLVAGGLWPNTPTINAVATAQQDNFAICTGPVDSDSEAVYFLDFLTGDLKGAVLSPQNGKFMSFFKHNILTDLQVDVSKSPRYLMVTGVNTFRRGPGGAQLGSAVVYIAEVTSGKVMAYGIPWSKQRGVAMNVVEGPFYPLDTAQFRNVAIRD